MTRVRRTAIGVGVPRAVLPASVLASPEAMADLRAIPGVAIWTRPPQPAITAPVDIASRLARIYELKFVEKAVDKRDVAVKHDALRPWQREGAQNLASGRKRALIWAAGSGKTAALLAAADTIGAKRVLIVTRAIGRDVFRRDAKWLVPNREIAIVMGLGGESQAVHRAIRKAGGIGTIGEAAAAWGVTVGWEILHAHAVAIAACGPWDVAIFDEAHCMKSRLAERTRAAFLATLDVTQRWAATATPVRDRLRDLSAQLRWIAPEAWGAARGKPPPWKRGDWAFVHRYCNAMPGRWGGLDTTGASHIDELKERLAYWWDVRSRAELEAFMPEVRHEIVRVPPGKIEVACGRNASALEVAIADAAERKREAVIDAAATALIDGEKVIVVGSRRAWVPKISAAIEKAVAPIRHVRAKLWSRWAHGEIGVTERQAVAREFMAASGPALLVATMDSIGESIDLHDADLLLLAALPWTPGMLTQMRGRVHRLGGRKVRIVALVAEGTIDEAIERSLYAKLAAAEGAGAVTDPSMRPVETVRSDEETVAELRAWLAHRADAVLFATPDMETA